MLINPTLNNHENTHKVENNECVAGNQHQIWTETKLSISANHYCTSGPCQLRWIPIKGQSNLEPIAATKDPQGAL